jgi:hypothetical protein
MCTISYSAEQHRLRLEGRCGDADAERIAEAVTTLGDGATVLIIDLTALQTLPPSVAQAMLKARDELGSCRVTMLRRAGTDVDVLLAELEPGRS